MHESQDYSFQLQYETKFSIICILSWFTSVHLSHKYIASLRKDKQETLTREKCGVNYFWKKVMKRNRPQIVQRDSHQVLRLTIQHQPVWSLRTRWIFEKCLLLLYFFDSKSCMFDSWGISLSIVYCQSLSCW